MARLACVIAVLAACGDNLAPPAPCDGVDPVFAHVVPLHAIVRALPDRGLVLGGTFAGTVTLGGQTITSAGGTDIFLARIDADGALTVATYGDAEDQELLELATNAAGQIAIAGRFRGTLDLGSTALVASTSSLFVARLDAFATRYPVEAILRALALSPAGDLALAGSNFDPLDFGGGALPTGGQFLGVLDAAGNHVASRLLAAEDRSVNLDVGLAFDGDDLLVAGSYTNSIDLGGGPLPSVGALDFYLARFGRGGTHRASRRLGGPGNDGFRGFDGDRVTIAPVDGGVVLASASARSLDELDDVFVQRLDVRFMPDWETAFAYPGFQALGALAIAEDGTIGITGISAGQTIAGTAVACGGPDVSHGFAATLSPDGVVRWGTCLPADFAAGLSLAFRDDELVIAGTFSGTLAIGSLELASEDLSGFVASVRPTCLR